jgi:pimeloyl-ACP methyl ester carboxylesterase
MFRILLIQNAERTMCNALSSSGLHKMAYHEWGDPNNQRVLICVHGLTRRGSDFTVLAKAMRDRYRVICPDIVGSR